MLGGKEYGSGSSRDWAAKGTSLLGVRAVITESFERIHRSNLIGMGVIPLQFPAGESAASLKLDGTETFDITGIEALNEGKTPKTVQVTATKEDGAKVEFDAVVRIDTPGEADYYRNGGILQYVLRNMLKSGSGRAEPSRHARVTDDHLAARRRQILDGARRCFAEYGYDKATVRRLEQTIGLSRGAIFHHFRDKDTLFFELAREDAERMADVASREGLIQVMRDMLAAPDQFDWLATRLEIARKLRNDPAFHRGWSERSAELSAATTDRLRRQKQAGRLRDDVPSAVLQTYLDLVLDGLVARLASGDDPEKLSAVLDLVEASVRQHVARQLTRRCGGWVRRGCASWCPIRAACCGWTVRSAGGGHQACGCSRRPRRRCAARSATGPGTCSVSSSTSPRLSMPRRIPSVRSVSTHSVAESRNRLREFAQASSMRSR